MNTASAPRSASRPTSCTRAARSAWKGLPRRSTSSSATEKSAHSGHRQMKENAIGVLGGTFDPVHNAHLEMARAALKSLPIDRLLFIPTGLPGYRDAPVASAQDRVAMLKLAIAQEPRYEIDLRELSPEATGFTVDTLGKLRAELGLKLPIYLLIGADQYAAFDRW